MLLLGFNSPIRRRRAVQCRVCITIPTRLSVRERGAVELVMGMGAVPASLYRKHLQANSVSHLRL